MDSRTSSQRAGVAALIMCLVLGVASVVAAQSGPSSDCTGDSVTTFGSTFFGLEDAGNRLLSTSPTSREFPMTAPLPAGTYALNGVSYDGYEARETISPQTQEQWFVEFLASDGSVLATSGITPDLADEVTEANWNGSLGEVTLAAPASVVRIVHAAPGSISVNSVRPVCIGATNTAVVETTTTTTTEAPVVAPPSVVSVEFLSTANEASTVSLTCGELTESATGKAVSLELRDIPAASGCVVQYPAALDCTLSVDPRGVAGASAAGIQNIVIPVAGGADVSTTIDCVEAQVASVVETTSTTAAPAVTATTTAPTVKQAVTPAVDSKVEEAKTATAQTGQPAFTG